MASLQQKVARRGRLFARRLKLIPRWDIEFLIDDKTPLHGYCQWWCGSHEAKITIQREIAESFPFLLDCALVHELGHLIIDGHKSYRRHNVHHERTLNTFAEALVTAYRGRTKE